MRSVILSSVLFLASLVVMPVAASELYVNQHNAQGSLAWHDASQVLGLQSDAASGVVVTRAGTDGTWGLQQGDVILAVDGHPVRQVAALVERLRASKPAAVKVRVRRDRAEQDLILTARDYGHLIGPKPPVPPPPPTAPAAPSPPGPPPPPASPSGD